MTIALELARIIISDINSQQALVLREKNGTREFPIIIGRAEAIAIDRYVRRVAPPRPMTHDLLRNAVEILGASIQGVHIYRLEEKTYYASIRLIRGDEQFDLDSRPSDAIAVATAFDPPLPILIEEDVFLKTMADQEE